MFCKLIRKYNKNKKICSCYNISNHDIESAINNGCNDINDIVKVTKAGTACGKCMDSLEYEVYKVLKK